MTVHADEPRLERQAAHTTAGPADSAGHAAPIPSRTRVASIDVLRGLVMIIMALDHVRDYVSGATFNPTDVEATTPAYFFTRWITHFCAPTFVFLAGVAAYLASARRTRRSLARFLLTRGLWLIVVEMTIVRFAWFFDFESSVRFGVIWALGISMISLAGLIYLPRWLPRWAIATVGIVMIAGHNLLDGIHVGPLVDDSGASLHAPASAWLWSLLHERHLPVVYPVIPWIGVMAVGYAFGPLLHGEPAERARRLTWLGLATMLGFVALRALNEYGDPQHWTSQHALSFLNTTKYPPSLLYLMMTLGPAIALLPHLERISGTRVGRAIAVFGRVPFFYYIVHLYLIHTLSWALSMALTGKPTSGFDLWVVYAVWAVTIALLYPVCRWFAGVKARRRDAWLSYL